MAQTALDIANVVEYHVIKVKEASIAFSAASSAASLAAEALEKAESTLVDAKGAWQDAVGKMDIADSNIRAAAHAEAELAFYKEMVAAYKEMVADKAAELAMLMLKDEEADREAKTSLAASLDMLEGETEERAEIASAKAAELAKVMKLLLTELDK